MSRRERLRALLKRLRERVPARLGEAGHETLGEAIPAPPGGIQRRFGRIGFTHRLLAGAIVILLLVAGVGGHTVLQTERTVGEDARKQLEHDALSQRNQVDVLVAGIHDQAGFVATYAAANPDEVERVDSFITTRQQEARREIAAVHYVERDGEDSTVLASSVDEFEGASPSSAWEGWSGQVLSDARESGETETTAPFTVPGETAPMLGFVEHVEDTDRYVVVMVNAAQASRYLQAPADGRTVVTNAAGTIVLGTDPSTIGESATESGYVNDEALSAAGERADSPYATAFVVDGITVDGQRQLTGGSTTFNQQWYVFTQKSTASAFQLRSHVRDNLIGLLVGVFLILFVVGGTVGTSTVRSLRRLADTAGQVSQGDLEAEVTTERTDVFGDVYESVDEMRTNLRDRIRELDEVNDRLEGQTEELETLHARMTAAVEEHRDVMADCATGDLTRRMSTETDVEQLDELGADFNEMMDDIARLLRETQAFGSQVTRSSDEAVSGMEDIRGASDEVTSAIQQINDGAERQSVQLEDASSEMDNLASTTEEIAASSDQVATIAERTATAGEEGQVAAERAIEGMRDVERDTAEAVAEIEQLADATAEIDELIDVIATIADQTNILALNANIEAARAGEAGEGFAVVAEQVKELAEDARAAAEEVEQQLEYVQGQTEAAVETVQRTSDEVATQSTSVERTVEALEEIAEFADETHQGIQEINELTDQQAQSVQGAVDMVDRVASISEETTSRAQEVASASEEQDASIREVSTSVVGLSEEAAQLEDLLREFEVPDQQSAPPRQSPSADDD